MGSFAEVVFILGVAGLFYAYIGFPLLVTIVGGLSRRRHVQAPITPRVTLIVAAYNEEDCIVQRIENALAADYPGDRLEVIVASDGSTDGTDQLVEDYPDPRVRLLRFPRRGKIFALNDAVEHATGEILVFTDANTVAVPGAIRAMARNFADPEVGGVVGHTGYRIEPGSESSSHGESLYWRYDTWLKQLESRAGSVVSAHGGLYAIRRELYQTPGELAVTDDFIISTAVVVQGYRLIFEPEARAWEATMSKTEREFQRRVRLTTRGLMALVTRAELLNPLRHGFYSVVLFSHKFLRRLGVPALLMILISSVALSPTSPFFRLVVGAQVVFYGAALLGYLLRGHPLGKATPLYVPAFYCMANIAAFVAILRFLRGDRIVSWKPQRHAEPA